MRQPPRERSRNNIDALRSIEMQCEQQIAHDPQHPNCANRAGAGVHEYRGRSARAAYWASYVGRIDDARNVASAGSVS